MIKKDKTARLRNKGGMSANDQSESVKSRISVYRYDDVAALNTCSKFSRELRTKRSPDFLLIITYYMLRIMLSYRSSM